MSPRTRCLIRTAGALLGVLSLTAACGAPPEALPTDPPRPRLSGSLPAGGLVPSISTVPPFSAGPVTPPPFTGMPMTPPPPFTGMPRTPPPVVTTSPSPSPSTSATPTPSHAARCAAEPTGSEILALAKLSPAVPDTNLVVTEGPYCSGVWSFTMIGMTGAEPLSVVTTGKGATLALVTAGTDVCHPRVKAEAPPGIRVLACGY